MRFEQKGVHKIKPVLHDMGCNLFGNPTRQFWLKSCVVGFAANCQTFLSRVSRITATKLFAIVFFKAHSQEEAQEIKCLGVWKIDNLLAYLSG